MNRRIYVLCELIACELSGEDDSTLEPLGDACAAILRRGVPGQSRAMWARQWDGADDDTPCPPGPSPLHSAQSRRAVVVSI